MEACDDVLLLRLNASCELLDEACKHIRPFSIWLVPHYLASLAPRASS
mgnify:CR=1 FL=1